MPGVPRLRCERLAVGYDGRAVAGGIDVSFEGGRVTAVVGANGCGKSTLLKTLARVLRPCSGAVLLDGQDVHALPTREVARRLAVLPQGAVAPEGLRVRELVAHGRFPHLPPFSGPRPEDRRAVERALAATGTTALADRTVGTLSGGERQRVWIATALAQETDVLLLDEPTTSLDLGHQIEVLDLVRRLNRDEGKTVVLVLHDLNHAARYADRVLALADGRVVADGTPPDVLTPETIERVFRVRADVIVHERTGALLVVPYGAAEPVPESVR